MHARKIFLSRTFFAGAAHIELYPLKRTTQVQGIIFLFLEVSVPFLGKQISIRCITLRYGKQETQSRLRGSVSVHNYLKGFDIFYFPTF